MPALATAENFQNNNIAPPIANMGIRLGIHWTRVEAPPQDIADRIKNE
jgi:hypothetical protein